MATRLSIADVLPLPNSSVSIPQLGFGVYQSPSKVCVNSCLTALKAGYRHIDSAQYYANEKEVGEAVRNSGLKRSEVFLTTKILVPGGSVENSYKQCLDSIHKIGGEDGYVDLFLIHSSKSGSKSRKEMWQALERLLEEGKVKSIGVSNWGIGHIEELKDFAKVYPPHVNQIELHPFHQQREVVAFCHKNHIIVEAYCPLVRNQKANDLMLNEIAKAHNKSVNHVLIRYCLQKKWVPLPKSDTPSRIIENAKVYDFELLKDEMAKLDALDQGAEGAIVESVVNTL
ncbi:putative aldo-keto reductase [Mollisia scopiformis]|uniref:Putative aldo-keto reductase n=1 Tax=Mollisia scopiformis TaxID=149040 RepID=A0A194WZB1_MOLSC|nr:putative aldo-keto reductase [Mollisia scopiformis]KUJ13044.1 putative aldo-keto reductase [Mollisia scopiformis]